MNPQNVHSSKFHIIRIVFETDDFTIAYGIWEDEKNYLGLRWNGDGSDIGFPNTFGRPNWMIVPSELSLPIVKGIMGVSGSEVDNILVTLKDLSKV